MATNPAGMPADMHRCPTRIDGAAVRFSHVLTFPMCQERQREHYHKCFTCVHKNGYAVPTVSAAAALSSLPPTPAPPEHGARPLPQLVDLPHKRAAV